MRYEWLHGLSGLLVLWVLAGCGLAQIDPQGLPGMAEGMSLGHDTIDVMVGDMVMLKPSITPEGFGERPLVWSVEDEEVVSVDGYSVCGLAEGESMVKVTSLIDMLSDSCFVRVWDNWDNLDVEDRQLYETVVLADIDFNGVECSDDLLLAAFINDHLACVASRREDFGVRYWLMRIWNDELHDDGEDAPAVGQQVISFQLYDRGRLRMYDIEELIDFDGETYGALSGLFKLKISR